MGPGDLHSRGEEDDVRVEIVIRNPRASSSVTEITTLLPAA